MPRTSSLTKIGESIVMVCSIDDWMEYLENKVRFKAQKYYHFGEPKRFPCFVFTIEEAGEPFYYFEHRFIYNDDAEILTEKHAKMHSRFASISNSD